MIFLLITTLCFLYASLLSVDKSHHPAFLHSHNAPIRQPQSPSVQLTAASANHMVICEHKYKEMYLIWRIIMRINLRLSDSRGRLITMHLCSAATKADAYQTQSQIKTVARFHLVHAVVDSILTTARSVHNATDTTMRWARRENNGVICSWDWRAHGRRWELLSPPFHLCLCSSAGDLRNESETTEELSLSACPLMDQMIRLCGIQTCAHIYGITVLHQIRLETRNYHKRAAKMALTQQNETVLTSQKIQKINEFSR